MMDEIAIEYFAEMGASFRERLQQIRAGQPDMPWYEYDSMTNVWHLSDLLPAAIMDALVNGKSWRVLDVGAADGDLGYFFESRGCRIEFLDNPSTNANQCRGIRAIGGALGSSAPLIIQDIDRGSFALTDQYDFAIALGLLYHLRNPMGFLMTLAEHAERMVLSTRIANHLPDGTDIIGHSVAYLLRCRESNNDPTNYWTMSPLGLETMLKRCGWNVIAKKFTGADVSNPVDQNADQRMFVYCERVLNWQDLGKHHDF
jgi:tRNA (mo5U34)-methyltransferase